MYIKIYTFAHCSFGNLIIYISNTLIQKHKHKLSMANNILICSNIFHDKKSGILSVADGSIRVSNKVFPFISLVVAIVNVALLG